MQGVAVVCALITFFPPGWYSYSESAYVGSLVFEHQVRVCRASNSLDGTRSERVCTVGLRFVSSPPLVE